MGLFDRQTWYSFRGLDSNVELSNCGDEFLYCILTDGIAIQVHENLIKQL